MRSDGGREVVLGGGGQGTSVEGVGLLRLLSVGAPAVGGGGRGTSTEAPAWRLHDKKKKKNILGRTLCSQNLPRGREQWSTALRVDA